MAARRLPVSFPSMIQPEGRHRTAMTESRQDQASVKSEVAGGLRRLGLLGADEPLDLLPLTGGVSSEIWRVTTAKGDFCVKRALARLKVAAVWEAPLERSHPYWEGNRPEALLIEEVEAIWEPIARDDDWSALEAKLAAIRRMGQAMGDPLPPAGHAAPEPA